MHSLNKRKTIIDVSIIIVNYKTANLLTKAIDSIIAKSENISYEIIVVDNDSKDNSDMIIQDRYHNHITYIKLTENIGFGRANNVGIKIANGRNILFLNPDIILLNNAVKLLSDYLDTHANVGVVGGNLYTKEGQPNVSFNRLLPSIFDEIDQATFHICSRIIYGKNKLFNYTQKPMEVGFIVGADMMVPKSVLDQVGLFDPDFFMYYEETELTWRIRNAGYKIMNIPQSHIIHLEGQSFTHSYDRELRSLTSRKLYYKKTHTTTYCYLANINYRLITTTALMISKLLKLSHYREKLQQRLNILNKIY